MNFTDPRFLLDLAQTIVIIMLWLRKPGQDAATAVRSLAERVDIQIAALHKEQAVFKERIEHMPTSEELAELEGTVRAINERTVGMADSMGTVRQQLSRIETYLLQSK